MGILLCLFFLTLEFVNNLIIGNFVIRDYRFYRENEMTPLEQDRFIKTHGAYEKITDRIMFLSKDAVINMNVVLYSYSERWGRRYYYSEVQYPSTKAGIQVKKMRRDFDCYLSLESLKTINRRREFIFIRPKDLQLLKMTLVPKLKDIIEKFNQIYEQDPDGKIRVNKYPAFEIELGAKVIVIAPGVHKFYNDELAPAVDMFLNSQDNAISMSFSKVYELLYVLETFQIHLYASSMISYLGRPPQGLNLYNMGDRQEYDNVDDMDMNIDVTKGRFIPAERKRRNVSYFDERNKER